MNKFFYVDIFYLRVRSPGLIVKTSAQLFFGRYRRLFKHAKKHKHASLQKISRAVSQAVSSSQQVHTSTTWRHPSLREYNPTSQGDLFGLPNFIPQLKRNNNENL